MQLNGETGVSERGREDAMERLQQAADTQPAATDWRSERR
jgi:uncharacterized protein YbjQ (UPF0145 family)